MENGNNIPLADDPYFKKAYVRYDRTEDGFGVNIHFDLIDLELFEWMDCIYEISRIAISNGINQIRPIEELDFYLYVVRRKGNAEYIRWVCYKPPQVLIDHIAVLIQNPEINGDGLLFQYELPDDISLVH